MSGCMCLGSASFRPLNGPYPLSCYLRTRRACRVNVGRALSSATSLHRALIQPPSSASHLSALANRALYQHPIPHPHVLHQLFQAAIRLILPSPRAYADQESRRTLTQVLRRLEPFVRPTQDHDSLILTCTYAAILADPSRTSEVRALINPAQSISLSTASTNLALNLESVLALGHLLRGNPKTALSSIYDASTRLSRLPMGFHLSKAFVMSICGVEFFRFSLLLALSICSDDPQSLIASGKVASFFLSSEYVYLSTPLLLSIFMGLGFGLKRLYAQSYFSTLPWNLFSSSFGINPSIHAVPLQGLSPSSHRRPPSSVLLPAWEMESWMLERAGLDAARFWWAIPDLREGILDLKVGKQTGERRPLRFASFLQDYSGRRRYFMLSVLLGLCRYEDVQGVREVHQILTQSGVPYDPTGAPRNLFDEMGVRSPLAIQSWTRTGFVTQSGEGGEKKHTGALIIHNNVPRAWTEAPKVSPEGGWKGWEASDFELVLQRMKPKPASGIPTEVLSTVGVFGSFFLSETLGCILATSC
ncbi:hypothetical protein BJ684DRAFT_19925 [Piptocephalis cylindrospora]|uniref:Uncharacterized protein n=1 Tax=Piptocephalis cylindrospora TaxID=1907219 RepID=A0A4P9Y3R4_9FUNG|nr:hypothetical protein BJ684DRAFT_19925 [Piptocephalis cylindrospora]|eukprot:RKP13598.1 hypothetical protein BJ684DRAFT_19925 [Piptocephalis cylindrospora]